MSSDGSTAHGRCLCGEIRYAVRGTLSDVTDCHCDRCRQFSGHHLAATTARLEELAVEDPASLLTWFWPVPEAGYAFCSRCGSSLFWQSSAHPDHRSICAGTLSTPTGLTTTKAVWVSQAGDYYRRPDVPETATE